MELLFLFIFLPFCRRHISCGQDKCGLIPFVYKKDNKVSSSPCTSKGRINVLTRAITFLSETELRAFFKNLKYFVSPNVVFLLNFLNDFIVPDKTVYFQQCTPYYLL
ncbi:MAG TPA: hypothetical protein ACFYD2_11465 [Candidatus Avalokitesvara rifleensis]|uniref:hypothetical protein n=1 Tax=Candidatus Avalokitesvara rifleensis TaxID=3367620 RepID=UPI004024F480